MKRTFLQRFLRIYVLFAISFVYSCSLNVPNSSSMSTASKDNSTNTNINSLSSFSNSSSNSFTSVNISSNSSNNNTSSISSLTSSSNPDQVDQELEEAKKYEYKPHISEQMPAIRINTPDDETNQWATKYNRQSKIDNLITYTPATISLDNCDDKYLLSDIPAQVKVRGNYTLDYEKKPIRIKFDKKQSVLGLNEGKKFKSWVLLADWKDLSMSNNSTAFYFGKTILGSDGYYSSDYRNVEVYLNNEFWGVYLLVEQQEVKDGRVNIFQEDDYLGTDIGYLVEYDQYYYLEDVSKGGDYTFEMDYYGSNNSGGFWWENQGQNGYTIKSDIYSETQVFFIKSYMENVYRIAYEAKNKHFYKFNETFTDIEPADELFSNTYETVSNVIDIQSLVDTYILSEIACDPDIAWSSFYMDVDMSAEGNKKLVFEAPWDFDSAFGMRSGYCNDAKGMYVANSQNQWLTLLVNENWFQEMVKEKWNKLSKYDVFNNALESIVQQKEIYSSYYLKNNERWPSRVSNGNIEVVGVLNSYKDIKTAQGLASNYLINWLTTRLNYLNEHWLVY